ncbi:hypothetical protein NUW58_g1161 [Xylaria curta]|uniref:Uncharacterized protein n=1 Tax=Xylaria curta TaxID=42375 RepID=A0ACC1PM08_9PEZI|nr:hypothetical protein NUW58_g1161 [Xylaria curta]
MNTQTDKPVAIIGTSCRLPGGATSPSRLWSLLCKPPDLSRRIPKDRFDPRGFYHPNAAHHGTTNVTNAYILEGDFRRFDAQFFHISRAEADCMDPQQRILLEIVYEAIEAAGLKMHDTRGTDTAVFVGAMSSDYNDLMLRDCNAIPTYLSTGTARSMLSARISYTFDWRGPSMTIDTACSSSLVALHEAVQVIRTGVSRIAVVAGVNLILGPEAFVAGSKLNMLSPTGQSRMWDSSADGYARGDGFVCVVIKGLADAIADGDDIEAVIRGSGVNQDGRTKGITVPSSEGQEALMRQVYRDAGLDLENEADHCQYFEAHGTGTPVGDPIEASAIYNTLRTTDNILSGNSLLVGSLKTVIGHTEGAAGLAGVLKALLAIKNGLIPPNLHLHHLNPRVEPYCKGLKVPTLLEPWPAQSHGIPRRASINSFGFGGTNAHVILESRPKVPITSSSKGDVPILLPFVFSAPTEGALRRNIRAHLENLTENRNQMNILDLSYTLACRRSAYTWRVSISALSMDSLLTKMAGKINGSTEFGIQSTAPEASGRILGIFTGQGAQWAGMTKELVRSFRQVSSLVDRLDGYLQELPPHERPEWSLRNELLADDESSRLSSATVAQPLCTVVQIILVDLLRVSNIKLDAVVGHSSGEIAAAYAAGYLSDRDAIYISYFRGLYSHLSQGNNGAHGAMMAVSTDVDNAQDLCEFAELQGRLSVAAVNSSTSVTLSGDEDAVMLAKMAFEDEGKFTRILKVDKAYHSHHMLPCSDSYKSALVAHTKIQRNHVTGPIWFSSVYGSPFSASHEKLEDSTYWNLNMVQPVLFSQALSSAVAEMGRFTMAIEIGPHTTLKEPVLQTMRDAGVESIPYSSMLRRGENSLETVAAAFGSVWAHAGDLAVNFNNIATLSPHQPKIVKDISSYCWDHERIHWQESQRSKAFRTTGISSHELLGNIMPETTSRELRWRNQLSIREIPWLRHHMLQGEVVFPAAGYVSMAIEASMCIGISAPVQSLEVRDLVVEHPMTFPSDETTVETLFTLTGIQELAQDGMAIAHFCCYSTVNNNSTAMVTVARGSLRYNLGDPSSSALPSRTLRPLNLVNLDSKRVYDSLQSLGYEYTGHFQGLSSIKRRFGAVSAALTSPASYAYENTSLLVPPSLLDSAFQSLFIAYSHPGDGMISTLYVPTHITRVILNVDLMRNALRQAYSLSLESVLTPNPATPLHGDVGIYQDTPGGPSYGIIQVEGLCAMPISSALYTDDRKLFENVIWGPYEPNAKYVAGRIPEEVLGATASQIVFRYGNLNILEIALEGKGFTESIFDYTEAYSISYDFALPPGSSVGNENKIADKYSHIRTFTIDIGMNVLSQGFFSQHYGLLIITGLETRSNTLKDVFENLRILLKPGGYLLAMLPLNRRVSPKESPEPLTYMEYLDSILRNASFSGVDSVRTIQKFNIFCSQSVDDRVLALRDPLIPTYSPRFSNAVYIIIGELASCNQLATELKSIMRNNFDDVIIINNICPRVVARLPRDAVILSLIDLQGPILKGYEAANLEYLKLLFRNAHTILWITKGCLGPDPYANMIVGFGRALLLENEYLRLNFLDIDPEWPISARRIANELLRLLLARKFHSDETISSNSLLWSIEPELALSKDGVLTIPRIVPDRERNNRYNSTRRDINRDVQDDTSVVELDFQAATSSYKLCAKPNWKYTRRPPTRRNIEILVRYSSLLALSAGKNESHFLVLGQIVGTRLRVITVSDVHASRIYVPEDWCFFIPEDISEDSEPHIVSGVMWDLYVSALLSETSRKDVLLLYEPPPGFCDAILRAANGESMTIHATTSTSLNSSKSQIPFTDITDLSSLRKLEKNLRENFPPIKGVANGAMVLRDTPVAEMTIDEMRKVLSPKVQGSLNLHEVFINYDLDFFILFSSVAAVVGNRGQANYSAANAFMSSLVAQRRACNLAGSVIHIGAVAGNGYLTREVNQSVQDYLQKAGYLWMSERDFHQVFAEGVLASTQEHKRCYEVMSGLNLTITADSNFVWANNPKFQHCLNNRGTTLASTSNTDGVLSIKDALRSASDYIEAQKIFRVAFVKKLQTLLLIDPDIHIFDSSTDDLGVDSLISAALRAWFSTELDVDVPIMKILGGAKITELVEYVVSRVHVGLKMHSTSGNHSGPSNTENNPSFQPPPLANELSSDNGLVKNWKPSLVSSAQRREPPLSGLVRRLPQSYAQARFWFLRSLLDDKTTSNVTCLLSLTGTLRTNDLEHAVTAVGQRHEALRTRFFEESGMEWQGIMETSLLKLEIRTLIDNEDLEKAYTDMKQHNFDLEKGDTMRILLLVKSPSLHFLIISYHHINMDGMSFMALITDLATFYAGNKPQHLGLQYSEFSAAQHDSVVHGKLVDQIAFWKNEYSQIPSPLPILPMSNAVTRKAMTNFDSHIAETVVTNPLQSRILAVCRKEKSTIFHFFITLFKIMLTRLTNVEDLSIGISHAGRTNETLSSVGNFLNILPLRLRSSKFASFAGSLREVKEIAQAAVANASVPIDVLFSELGIERHAKHNPLFQAFVNYQRVNETQRFDNCILKGERYTIGRTGYDISLDVIDDAVGEFSLSLMVQKRLYAADDAKLLLHSLLKLADAFSGDLSLQTCKAPLYDDKMVDEALELGQGLTFKPKWETIIHAVDHLVHAHPSRIALRDGLGNSFSYERIVYWICSMLAIMRCGATYVPLDARSGLPRLSVILKESGVSVVLTQSDTMGYISSLGADPAVRFLNIDALSPHSNLTEVPNRATGASNGVILYTSGSTGVPKGIPLSHRSLQMHMESCISQWRLGQEVVLQHSTFSFDLSVYQIYLALITGGVCFVVPREARGDGLLIARIISQEGITVTGGVPTECLTWIQHSKEADWRNSDYKMMICGGEPFSFTLADELRRVGKSDLRAMNIYGPSEVTIASNAFEVQYHKFSETLDTSIPVGFALPNYSIVVLDEDLQPVPTGVPGQIAVTGPISTGYVNDRLMSQERFIDPTFTSKQVPDLEGRKMHLTGDRGRLRRSDGALIFEGRITHDTQIKLRGIRIDLRDIESSVTAAAKGAILATVVSVRGKSDKFLVAHVLLAAFIGEAGLPIQGAHSAAFDELLRSLTLPESMRPAIVIPLSTMPLTSSGKIDRRAIEALPLPEVDGSYDHSDRDLSPTERSLAISWRSILVNSHIPAIHPIGAESDFFGVGGNSLLLMRMQAKVEETFGVRPSLIQLFSGTSLRGMATTIDALMGISDVVVRQEINWDRETVLEFPYNIPSAQPDETWIPMNQDDIHTSSTCKTVILTGATGHLGQHILLAMLANPDIRHIHCIAVRMPDRLNSVSDPRISVHSGDLKLPRLGLGLEDAKTIFEEADVIVHNGADVSFLKTYTSLRASNVNSTKELIRLASIYPRPYSQHRCRRTFHYISSVGIAQLQPNISEFHPYPASSIPEPVNESNGYAASKWVSERVLERLAINLQSQEVTKKSTDSLHIVIHRPSSIVSSTAHIPPRLDIVQNLLEYSEKLRAVPENLGRWWKGYLDLVRVEDVARGVVQCMIKSSTVAMDEPVWYKHHSGAHEVRVDELRLWLETTRGVPFQSLALEEWLEKAREAGIHEAVASYMQAIAMINKWESLSLADSDGARLGYSLYLVLIEKDSWPPCHERLLRQVISSLLTPCTASLEVTFFNFEFIRILGTVPFGGAETAECLDAVSQIRDGNAESWCRAWLRQAQRAEAIAAQACRDGDSVAARDALIRSSNYYRAAQYMTNGEARSPEPYILELSEKSVMHFHHAVQLIDHQVEVLSIPYQGGLYLPGYLYLPPQDKRLPGQIPLLLVCGGADSTQEELYSLFPAAGVERGYAVVTFDGPGQGIFLRRHGVSMRPDWEVVIGHVLNHIFSFGHLFDLDYGRIGIAGASMGAYFALRGASDHRIATCVAIDPIYDMWDLATDRMPTILVNAWASAWLTDRLMDGVWRALSLLNFQLRWELQHCMWIFGSPTPSSAMREMRRWTLRGDSDNDPFLSRVHCPVLVSGASRTIYTKPDISTMRVVRDLAHLPEDKKDVWIADDAGDGGLQGKVGAWRLTQQRTFAFLDRHMQVSRPSLLKSR